uniref:CCHC-type domain-containing protein n=1 Tax=Oryza punctata TaxID=4537 RepID=A0A0E0LYG2_ORYPU
MPWKIKGHRDLFVNPWRSMTTRRRRIILLINQLQPSGDQQCSRNLVNKAHESLPAPISVGSMHNQKNAFLDEPGTRLSECPLSRPTQVVCCCFNCGKIGHIAEGCPMPKRQDHQVSSIVPTPLPPQVTSIAVQSGQQPLQGYDINTGRASNARKPVIYSNGKETVQCFSSNRSQCLKCQASRLPSTSAMHLMLFQFRWLASNHMRVASTARRFCLFQLPRRLMFL